LRMDIGQKADLSDKYPEIVKNLKALGNKHMTYVRENSREPASH